MNKRPLVSAALVSLLAVALPAHAQTGPEAFNPFAMLAQIMTPLGAMLVPVMAQMNVPQASPGGFNPAALFNPAQFNPAQFNPAQFNPAQFNPAALFNQGMPSPAMSNPSQFNPTTLFNPGMFKPVMPTMPTASVTGGMAPFSGLQETPQAYYGVPTANASAGLPAASPYSVTPQFQMPSFPTFPGFPGFPGFPQSFSFTR